MKQPITRGVVLIAIGPAYYTQMAYNLAATLKAAGDISITVFTDAEGSPADPLTKEQWKMFDQALDVTGYTPDMDGAMKLRLRLPGITPYRETLALDVDMAWLSGRDPNELFALLTDRDITYVNEGYYDIETGENHATPGYTTWAEPADTAVAYKLTGKLYFMRGELLLFRNSPAIRKAFTAAAKIQAKPMLMPRTLGGAVPEEYALNIALNKAGIEPHESRWQPTYWPLMRGSHLPVHELPAGTYAFSVGGNSASLPVRAAYNIITGAARHKLGLGHMFPLVAKRSKINARIHA